MRAFLFSQGKAGQERKAAVKGNSSFSYEIGLDPHCIIFLPVLLFTSGLKCFLRSVQWEVKSIFQEKDFYFDWCVLKALLLK